MKYAGTFLFILLILSVKCESPRTTTPPFEPIDWEKLGVPDYKKNELLITYKDLNARKKWSNSIKEILTKIDPKLEMKSVICSSGSELAELLIGDNLHEVFQKALDGVGDLIRTSPVRTSGATGDTSVVVSLNFLTSISDSFSGEGIPKLRRGKFPKDTVIVGILDSGLDTTLFPNEYLWKKDNQTAGANSSRHDFGWNFIDRNSDVTDFTDSKHGTLVNLFVLEQFFRERENFPKLLNAKVLGPDNSGTLFDCVCGVLYVKENGARIINMSLGFYDNDEYSDTWEGKNPIMYNLINQHLLPEGIILVTAAGNISIGDDIENLALRNLAQNKFYPAVMSNATGKMPNNVITATTVDVTASEVSPRQNYSPLHVDVGVVANVVEGDVFRFFVPFSEGVVEGRPWVTGSSFAAPVITGKIAARFDPSLINSVKTEPKYYWLNGLFGSQMYPNSENLVNQIDRGRYTRIE